MLDQVKIVLVGTSHSGNIGSAARAMKVMGLKSLVLVDPQCELDAQAYALASGADDVIRDAVIVETLEQAVGNCSLVLGSSARARSLDWPLLEPRECGEKVIEQLVTQSLTAQKENAVALVFGRERTGLTNEELQLCQYHISIPANPEYSSLNLAMAVQTFSYEIRMAFLTHQKNQYPASELPEYPRHQELELFYQHLEKVLLETKFLSTDQPNLVMNKFRRMFSRTLPEQQELNMLRGVLTAIEKKLHL